MHFCWILLCVNKVLSEPDAGAFVTKAYSFRQTDVPLQILISAWITDVRTKASPVIALPEQPGRGEYSVCRAVETRRIGVPHR